MSIFKKIGIGCLVIIFTLCLGIDVWYAYIMTYGPAKLAVNTVNTGLMTDVNGVSKYIGKIKYNSNANKNGHECFAWQINYFRDENTDGFHSQGFQYETEDVKDVLEFYTYEKFAEEVNEIGFTELDKKLNKFIGDSENTKQHRFLWTGTYNAYYINPYLVNGLVNNYQSMDGFASLGTTNPITEDSVFTIQVSDNESDLMYMQFLGSGFAEFENQEYKSSRQQLGHFAEEGTFSSSYNYFYYNYSADWFGYYLYNAVKVLPAGTNGTFTLEFGDFFKFYEVNSDGSVGKEIQSEDGRANVIEKIKSYFVFEVEVSADGARSAKDSMFGILHGSANYSVNGYDGTDGDYSFGANVISLDVYDFQLVKVNETDIALKLKEEVLQNYLPFADKIYLHIKVDKSLLSAQGYNYTGFAGDSGLENFKIHLIEEV